MHVRRANSVRRNYAEEHVTDSVHNLFFSQKTKCFYFYESAQQRNSHNFKPIKKVGYGG